MPFLYFCIFVFFAFGCNALYSHYGFICIALLYFFNFVVYYSYLYAMFFLFFLYKSPAACITNIIFF